MLNYLNNEELTQRITEMVKPCKYQDLISNSIFATQKIDLDKIIKDVSNYVDTINQKVGSIDKYYTNPLLRYADTQEISEIDKFLRSYSVTQTMPDNISFVPTEPLKTEKKRERTLQELYSLTPEGFVEYFVEKQEECKSIVDGFILELKRWELQRLAYTTHNPTVEDYDEKLKELYAEIKLLDNKIPIERYFAKGPDDSMLAGVYLATLAHKPDKEIVEEFVKLLSGIQWLIRRRNEKKDNASEEADQETPLQPQVNTPKEVLKILLIKYLKLDSKGTNVEIGDNTYNRTRLMVATREVLEERNTFPFKDEKDYADFIASLTGESSENVRKNINHQFQGIKAYGVNLKKLNEDYIKRNQSEVEKGMTAWQYRNQWEGLFELIDNFINQEEELAILRSKPAQTPH